MTTVPAYAATSANESLTKTTITRRDPGPRDVAIEVKFAGLCHSDIHAVKAEWGQPNYPVVPGHEIARVVVDADTIHVDDLVVRRVRGPRSSSRRLGARFDCAEFTDRPAAVHGVVGGRGGARPIRRSSHDPSQEPRRSAHTTSR